MTALSSAPQHNPQRENPRSEPKTLVEAAYRSLRRDIIEGRLPPGEKLRIEHIKDNYGVGGATLREALSLLIADALVISQGQRGFRVAPVSLDDFRDITRTRIQLECEALRQSMRLGDDEWEGQLYAAFHRLSRADEKLSAGVTREEWEERNQAFHEALIAACPSRWIKHFLAILYRQAERYRRLSLHQPMIPRDLHAEHEALFKAVLARDETLACTLLSGHISHTLESVLKLPERELQ